MQKAAYNGTERRIIDLPKILQRKSYVICRGILPAEDIQTARAHIDSTLHLNADDFTSFLQNEIKLGRSVTFPTKKRIVFG